MPETCVTTKDSFARREAFEQPFELEYTGSGTKPDFSSGTYRALGASNIDAFKKEFVAAGQDGYLFEIESATIIGVSDFDKDLLIVPLSEDDTDTPTDIYLAIYANYSTYAKPIKIVRIPNCFNNVNTTV